MKEKLQSFGEAVKALWGKLSRVAKIVLLTAIVVVIVGCIILAAMLNRKNYVLLNNAYSTTERAMVTAVLSEQGIDYRMEPDGAILVLDKDMDKAIMQIATAGLPGGVYDENYNPSLTSTQSDKQYLQKNELQKRLQNIILTFEEVDQAIVTISMPERSAFALQTDVVPPSANVTVITKDGYELTSAQIRGIINIVKDSVAGIEEENISIVGENGDLKNYMDSMEAVNNAKLQLTNEVNETLKNRAMSLLRPMFGAGNVYAEINSVLDTDARASEILSYNPFDPEDPGRNPYDYTEHYRDRVAGDGGLAQGVPGANDNVQTPEYGELYDDDEGNTAYSSHDIYDYLVGHTVEQISKEGYEIVNATAAVVVNTATLPNGQRDEIISLVSKATGIPVADITVLNYEFYRGEALEADPPGILPAGLSTWQIVALVAGCLLIAAILAFLLIYFVRRKKKAEEELEAQEEGELRYDEDGMPLMDLFDEDDGIEPITLVETTEQKLRAQIKDLADSDPEIVASLLKNWLSSPN